MVSLSAVAYSGVLARPLELNDQLKSDVDSSSLLIFYSRPFETLLT